jgi:hypothetical protein
MPHQTSRETKLNTPSDDAEESCRSCLYTGVATCIGLSAYFAQLAIFEDDTNKRTCRSKGADGSTKSQVIKQTSMHSNPSLKEHLHLPDITSTKRSNETKCNLMQRNKPLQVKSNRPFLLVCSACWAAAGAYRWYLN